MDSNAQKLEIQVNFSRISTLIDRKSNSQSQFVGIAGVLGKPNRRLWIGAAHVG